MCTAVLIGLDPANRNLPPSPAFGFIYEGAIGKLSRVQEESKRGIVEGKILILSM
jgi:hypothetical protein